MLKPSDIKLTPTLNADHLRGIEKQFDAAITAAQASGKWPAHVGNARDSASEAEIEHVADRYRSAGWKVVSGQRSERAIIDHPDRQR